MAKVEHFWVSIDLADAFITWLGKQPEIEAREAMRGTFTPERARFVFRDAKYGFEQAFMLYDSAAFRCVNVPRNAMGALLAFAKDAKAKLPDGKLDTARGDGKDAASIARAREEKKAAAKAAKAAAKAAAPPAKAKAPAKAKDAAPPAKAAKAGKKK